MIEWAFSSSSLPKRRQVGNLNPGPGGRREKVDRVSGSGKEVGRISKVSEERKSYDDDGATKHHSRQWRLGPTEEVKLLSSLNCVEG